jgi:hypothetical protein
VALSTIVAAPSARRPTICATGATAASRQLEREDRDVRAHLVDAREVGDGPERRGDQPEVSGKRLLEEHEAHAAVLDQAPEPLARAPRLHDALGGAGIRLADGQGARVDVCDHLLAEPGEVLRELVQLLGVSNPGDDHQPNLPVR